MGRRSRHTAKTGDKSIYKSRSATNRSNKDHDGDDDDDNDPMYNEVERYHLRREEENFLKLDGGDSDDDGGGSDDEDDGITKHQEGVFDLGIGGSSDEDEDDDDSEDSDDQVDGDGEKRNSAAMASSSDDDDDDSEDDGDDDDDNDGYKSKQLLNWGDKKHSYYHGDTADLEIGQNIEDAHLEEEAGREVEKARLVEMEDADFMLDGVVDDDDADDLEGGVQSRKKKSKADPTSNMETIQSIQRSRNNLFKLSKSEKIKFLKANHSELLPLVQHFSPSIQELSETTMVAAGALLKRGVVNGAKEAKVRVVHYCVFHVCLNNMDGVGVTKLLF